MVVSSPAAQTLNTAPAEAETEPDLCPAPPSWSRESSTEIPAAPQSEALSSLCSVLVLLLVFHFQFLQRKREKPFPLEVKVSTVELPGSQGD